VTEKKHGLLDSIASVFTTEVPEKAAPTRNTPLPPERHSQPGLVAVSATQPDSKALSVLESRLQAAIPPAYASFLEMYQSLAEDIPDESKRVKAALKTSKTTVDQVVVALDQLVGVMEVAHQEFLHSQQEKLAAHQALEDSIKAKDEQLHHLQEEINSLRERSVTEQSRIDQVKAGFEAAHAQTVGRLQSQKARIAGMR